MFVAQDNVLWYSMPFSYHSFDLNKGNLVFPSRITMVKSVVSSFAERGGLYVSDENKTYFMSGMRPKEFIQIEVADYPAVEGTGILIDGRKVGKGDVQNNVIMWVSTEGICLGSPDGVFMNLTERKLKYPKANSGAGVCIDDKYVCTLKAPSWTSADGFI